MILVEVGNKSLRNDEEKNDQLLYESLALLDEVRDKAARREVY